MAGYLSGQEKGLGTAAVSLESRRPSPSVQGTGKSPAPQQNAVGETLQVGEADNRHGVLEIIRT